MVSQAKIGPIQTEGHSKELGNKERRHSKSIVVFPFQHHLTPVKLGKARGAGNGHGLDVMFFHVLEFFSGNLIGRLRVNIGPQG